MTMNQGFIYSSDISSLVSGLSLRDRQKFRY